MTARSANGERMRNCSAAGGLYADLYRTQFASQESLPAA